MKCPKCNNKVSDLDLKCPVCNTDIEGYRKDIQYAEDKVYKKWEIWVGIILILLIIIFMANYNSLSRNETVGKFIDLVSKSEYKEAKKYITSNFEWDLDSIKKRKLEYADSFTYSYGDYRLENDYDIAYITINLKEINAAEVIKFKLKQTIFGFKIDGYVIDWIEY